MKPSKYAPRPRSACSHALVAVIVIVWLTAVPVACGKWPPALPLEQPSQREVVLLPASISAASRGGGLWDVTFRFTPSEPVNSVSLAGSFNGWNPRAEPMTRVPDSDAWTRTTLLGPGHYEYKFVLNGGHWLHDPLNPERVGDNHGGFNSVLMLGRLAAMSTSDGKVGDEQINAIGLLHDPKLPLYFQPLSSDRVLLRYRTLAHDAARVWAAVKDAGLTEMHVATEDQLFAIWEACVTLPKRASAEAEDAPREIAYTFVLADRNKRVGDPHVYEGQVDARSVFHTPDWAQNSIWYQIMPDRFRNGTTTNDPDPVRPWTSEWFTPSPWEEKNGWTFYKYYVFFRQYGGDFQGIEEELPYLKELGVNALYFNPIFQAPTHHKYNADNYLHVDEHLGVVGDYDEIVAREDLNDPSTWQWTQSDKVFLHFLEQAHAMGLHIIIDGVFNHVGSNHVAFLDVKKNGPNSKYADWFDVTSWAPFEYRGWAGVDTLPVFKKSADGLASEAVKQHIFNVTRRWMDPDGDGDPSDGIDGWRLDVPNEIAAPFWVEWREVVKSVNPDAYIVGEIWDRADTWLDGKHFDAVMNYEFARAAVTWVCNRRQSPEREQGARKITATEIDQRLAKLRLAYPAAATYVLQNLVDSHDTDRLVSMALNPNRAYDKLNRVQDSNPDYNNAKPGPEEYRRARLVVLLQMTYVGAPMVYYGDEVGMWGADDPTNRKPMFWEDLQPYEQPDDNFVMADHLDFYRRAIALRAAHPALRVGTFQTLLTDDRRDVWAFVRRDGSEQLIVVLNASDSPQVVDLPRPDETGHAWSVVFGNTDALRTSADKLTVRVPAMAGVVLYTDHTTGD